MANPLTILTSAVDEATLEADDYNAEINQILTKIQNTPTASTIPYTTGAGKLQAGYGGAASTLATLNSDTLAVEMPAVAWTTPAFDADDFTGSSSMTWVLTAGDRVTLAYFILGKMMTVSFSLTATTVATPDTYLLIKIPASKTATKTMVIPGVAYDNSAWTGTQVFTTAASTNISIGRGDLADWTAGSDTVVNGQITFEID